MVSLESGERVEGQVGLGDLGVEEKEKGDLGLIKESFFRLTRDRAF
jgi:hypothetical protein